MCKILFFLFFISTPTPTEVPTSPKTILCAKVTCATATPQWQKNSSAANNVSWRVEALVRGHQLEPGSLKPSIIHTIYKIYILNIPLLSGWLEGCDSTTPLLNTQQTDLFDQ